jgi:hypothetical protein
LPLSALSRSLADKVIERGTGPGLCAAVVCSSCGAGTIGRAKEIRSALARDGSNP